MSGLFIRLYLDEDVDVLVAEKLPVAKAGLVRCARYNPAILGARMRGKLFTQDYLE